MSQEIFDFVIPLYRIRWNTRAVLEGITYHYQPRAIHVIAPYSEAQALAEIAQDWQIATLHTHEEETFFQTIGLSKDVICQELDLKESLYTPGWFYQQLLKLGAFEGIENLSEWYVVWDSDLLPLDAWQLIREKEQKIEHTFALLQHNGWGNPNIVGKWDKWIRSVLKVEPINDREGTFVPHHIWFKQEHLKSFARQVNQYYQSDDNWLVLMMRSANKFGTFSEYWSYVSWVADKVAEDLSFYPYEQYGKTTERFFDDGTGLFFKALKKYQASSLPLSSGLLEGDKWNENFPTYERIMSFAKVEYGENSLPSSLSFESSPRHLKKNAENMHIEESRSRWNLRNQEISDTISNETVITTS